MRSPQTAPSAGGSALALPRAGRLLVEFADDSPPVGQVLGRHLVGVKVRHGGTLKAKFAQLRVGRHAHGAQLGDGLAFLCERDDFTG